MTDRVARPTSSSASTDATAAPVSMPRGAHEDPRMPRLGCSAGFTEFIAGQWGEVERQVPVAAGAAEAAAGHRGRLSAAFPDCGERKSLSPQG